jgi:hypothetical protein
MMSGVDRIICDAARVGSVVADFVAAATATAIAQMRARPPLPDGQLTAASMPLSAPPGLHAHEY